MKVKNLFKKAMCLALSAVMVFTFAAFASAADADVDYTIQNPYAKVDFDTYKAYKADLHSHTTFSDGHDSLPAMTERHYELGFDIYARTDHSTVSYGYLAHDYVPAMKVLGAVKNGALGGEVLSTNGTASNGKTYTVTKNDADDEFYAQDGGHAMLSVPFGNEQNGTSFNNAHVNTLFVDYGNGRVGGTSDYESVISEVHGLGGLSVINHPGEYTNARDEVYTADAYNKDDVSYGYKINKFENLLLKYDTCIGIDINSKGDSRTRFDRKLWDIMLGDLIPHGRNVFAIATSDAHNLDIVDSGYTMHYLPALTSAALKANMEQGAFFPASKYVGNFDELVNLSKELKAVGGTEALALAAQLDEIIAQSEIEMAEGDSGRKYEAPKNVAAPIFTNVKVDETEDVIALEADNALVIHWIADGKVIHVGNSIDLDDYSSEIGSYVRAEAYGVGGVMYTQAFALEYDGAPEAEDRAFFIDLGGIASAICDTPVRFLFDVLPLDALASFIV
ncbi:MAG: hypothetical protein IIW48_09180, partial [Clostridia bacterium]|nr:hypothetical protein [Clostridia bacterium]